MERQYYKKVVNVYCKISFRNLLEQMNKLNKVLKSLMSERFILLSLFTLQVSSPGITDGGFIISLFQFLHDILCRNLWKRTE